MIGNFPSYSLELLSVISQTQPVHLELAAGSPRSQMSITDCEYDKQ